MAKSKGETPLMQQHREIKQRYPDAILLFRVGDFYETFGQDAVDAARVLGITLTKRNSGNPDAMELAGFPHHALDAYLHKLVKGGYRVAVVDQLEDPKAAKGIVKRGVTELVTPGLAIDDKLLENGSNNFLAAIHYTDQQMGAAFLDISTGEFFVAEGTGEYIEKLVQSLRPAEIIYQRSHQKKLKEHFGSDIFTYTLEAWIFDLAFATEALLKHFQVHSLKGFGIDQLQMGIIAAGAVLHYLKETQHPDLDHITQIQRIEKDDFLWMDRFTIRNLELLPTGRQAGEQSLLQVLDTTRTAMGARLLKRWLIMPLIDEVKIQQRLTSVESLVLSPETLQSLQGFLAQSGDLERLASKVAMKRVGPREVVQLADSLGVCQDVKVLMENQNEAYLGSLGAKLEPCTEIREKITRELVTEPPAQASKGGIIAAGVSTELDELREISANGKSYLEALQKREAEITGISSLKVGFNNVFGYYLEVTNLHKDKVPESWIRKQTLASAERYITEELKIYEEKITGAQDKIAVLESRIYNQLLDSLATFTRSLQRNAQLLATLDLLGSFAANALKYNYHKPALHRGTALSLKESRHPVIERYLPPGEPYVANDIELDSENQQIIILTGPNMSGKSALLRQTALITLMAHMGSFVPAKEAQVPLTDKIFTRVGASDNLSGGESTFMVEMNETASIINNISPRSLILLDEIGRGTSTYDGISIAWSIVEFLHGSAGRPKTLFATHYHELNDLESYLSRVKNYHITNKEIGHKIIFLRKLAPGGSTHSFGIHVAKMAGMPPSLTDRATQILEQLELKRDEEGLGAGAPEEAPAAIPKVDSAGQGLKKANAPHLQLSIFDTHTEVFDQIRSALNEININELTPVEALLKLNQIKGLLK
ncbi:DNA mismatch repair protein MutS [Arachidicoccus terrestris]|uniref:DNA mismatch repair protein MutS n=1 Tax=Arachidicoccus terrestris TaxID=2875539 RepID=UPI001CC3495D|nr:DNA mismatch repair protein MutS [Arachidicoccus terrestris]UAY54304.1 DNA mismatch repair protein MutS [Arachidicoccus terrestris]